jgi:hypothetical protein
LDSPAGRIHADRYRLTAVGTAYLDLRVPEIRVSRLKRSVRVFWV